MANTRTGTRESAGGAAAIARPRRIGAFPHAVFLARARCAVIRRHGLCNDAKAGLRRAGGADRVRASVAPAIRRLNVGTPAHANLLRLYHTAQENTLGVVTHYRSECRSPRRASAFRTLHPRRRRSPSCAAARIWAVVSVLAAIAAGCRRDASSDGSAAASGRANDSLARYVATAPQEPAAFLDWAWDALQRTPDPQPPPEPRLPQPQWPIVRLGARFDPVNVRSEWRPGDQAAEALLRRGPFASDADAPDFRYRRTQRTALRSAPIWRMEFLNLGLDRRQVGRIELVDLEVPGGEYIQLNWPGPAVMDGGGQDQFTPAAWVRVPIAEHGKPRTISIPTDGLAFWAGPLDFLNIEFDGKPEAPVKLRELRLYGRARAFPQAAGPARVALGNHLRDALYARAPAEILFPGVPIPADGRFQAGLAFMSGEAGEGDSARPAGGDGGAVAFELIVRSAGEDTDVSRESVTDAGRWRETSHSLSQWAGQTVDLVLRANSSRPDVVAFWGAPCVYQPLAKPPLAILYLIDTLTSTRMGLYGYERPTTPRLAALAEQGAWLRNMYCNSPMTVISVKDLLLGVPAVQHGVHTYSTYAPDYLVPLPAALRAAGYATAMFSTNVVAGPREKSDRGFDSFFDCVPDTWGDEADRTVPIEQALEWLAAHRDRPAFMYIHTAEPHAPYFPPPGFRGRFDADYAGPIDGSIQSMHEVQSERDIAHARALYDEEVLYADHRFGLFADALAQAGLLDGATILVTADHGEHLFEHGEWAGGHGVRHLYEEALRVPLIVRGPAVRARGPIERPAQLLDVMPTMLDLLGVAAPAPPAGESLAPLLRGEAGGAEPARDIVTCAVTQRKDVQRYVLNESGRWKLICGRATTPGFVMDESVQRFELYDLHADPGEQRDVLHEHPDVVRRLVAKLLRFKDQHRPYDVEATPGEVEFDAKQLRELRSLGYVP